MNVSASLVLAVFVLLLGGGCDSDRTATRPAATAPQQEAVSRIGDVTIRASVLPTATLAPEVATRYGIAREPGTLLLLVGVRQGPEAQEAALPARINATVTNLSGQRQEIALREVRTGDSGSGPGQALLDYIGIVETTLPDQLRFELTIVREGGATSTMQFSREFYPR